MNIVIFGQPGAGKGTQSNFIVKRYNLHQLSTGELLRKEIKEKTKLGQEIETIMNSGNLVSDKIVSDLIENYLSNETFSNRLIFDGYPRNLIQVKNLDNLLKKYNQKIDIVLKLSVSLETIKKRISERKTLEKREDIFKNVSDSAKPKLEIVIGKRSNAEAKIAGITPAVLIFRGRCDDSPPYILFPTCLLG